jgi:hypothetical protein
MREPRGGRPGTSHTSAREPPANVMPADQELERSRGEAHHRSSLAFVREPDRAWRDDVALEMWIDESSAPVVIRLAGTLDESTGANLDRVVDECLAKGKSGFDLDTRALRITRSGQVLMERIRRRVAMSGGQLSVRPVAAA